MTFSVAPSEFTRGDDVAMLSLFLVFTVAGLATGRLWSLLFPVLAAIPLIGVLVNDEWYSRVPKTGQIPLCLGVLLGLAGAAVAVAVRT